MTRICIFFLPYASLHFGIIIMTSVWHSKKVAALSLTVSRHRQQQRAQRRVTSAPTTTVLSTLFLSTTPSQSSSSFYEPLAAFSSSETKKKNDHVTPIAQQLGVKPGMMDFSPRFWKFAWRMHGRLLPLLHYWDKARTADLDNCLKVLWCKALVGLDQRSPAYDGGLAYDMLPSVTRRLVTLPERFFPRLVHFIIELRTVYLDRALREEIQHAKNMFSVANNINNHTSTSSSKCRIRLVTLGAGYDTRSVKFLNDDDIMGWRINEAWELDMPQVVASKSIMLDRLQTRRPNAQIPRLIGQDLTDFEGLTQQLTKILDSDRDSNNVEWHTVFLVEGVLIYLKEADRSKVLSTCADMLKSHQQHGSFLFSDRIRKLRDPDTAQVQGWLRDDGWQLVDGSFCVHPGKARHMGAARVN